MESDGPEPRRRRVSRPVTGTDVALVAVFLAFLLGCAGLIIWGFK